MAVDVLLRLPLLACGAASENRGDCVYIPLLRSNLRTVRTVRPSFCSGSPKKELKDKGSVRRCRITADNIGMYCLSQVRQPRGQQGHSDSFWVSCRSHLKARGICWLSVSHVPMKGLAMLFKIALWSHMVASALVITPKSREETGKDRGDMSLPKGPKCQSSLNH